MNRNIFFLLEKLRITRQERVTLSVLIMVLLVISLVNVFLEPQPAAEAGDYAEIKREFDRKTKLIARQEAELMRRYNPGPVEVRPAVTSADTIPVPEDTTTKEPGKGAGNDTTRININTASVQKLQELPGVGPVYARRIVAYRDSSGKFQTIRELVKIKGIGEKRLENMESMIEL
ncbi:ComEA family DNA-binding protein [Halalkalibaculum sp. DA384]|uniref:ComEA family DNA-binding protein n=1 Tax=Halalkalibaculum sp. DA384 TaxID=3373606 RepID=UPI0037546558